MSQENSLSLFSFCLFTVCALLFCLTFSSCDGSEEETHYEDVSEEETDPGRAWDQVCETTTRMLFDEDFTSLRFARSPVMGNIDRRIIEEEGLVAERMEIHITPEEATISGVRFFDCTTYPRTLSIDEIDQLRRLVGALDKKVCVECCVNHHDDHYGSDSSGSCLDWWHCDPVFISVVEVDGVDATDLCPRLCDSPRPPFHSRFLALEAFLDELISSNLCDPELQSERQEMIEDCEDGNAEVCHTLGKRYFFDERDYQLAVLYFEMACDLDHAEGCYMAGRLHGGWATTVFSLSTATGFFRRACELGHTEGCHELGKHYRYGWGVPEDFTRAYEIFRDLCDEGHSSSCMEIGSMYYHGQGVTQDRQRAAELFYDACQLGHPGGCNRACDINSEYCMED